MAVIEHVTDIADWGEKLRAMDRAEMIAQQLVQRGALNALEFLIDAGPSPEMAQRMIDSLKEGLMMIHTVASQRGIELVGYEADPESRGHG